MILFYALCGYVPVYMQKHIHTHDVCMCVCVCFEVVWKKIHFVFEVDSILETKVKNLWWICARYFFFFSRTFLVSAKQQFDRSNECMLYMVKIISWTKTRTETNRLSSANRRFPAQKLNEIYLAAGVCGNYWYEINFATKKVWLPGKFRSASVRNRTYSLESAKDEDRNMRDSIEQASMSWFEETFFSN